MRRVYSFPPFVLEVDERRLLRTGQIVPLNGKAFDTLQLLVEGAGTLQKRESLMDRLWPDVEVEQNSLEYNISIVRRAIAGATGIEIETVRGQGYRLLADVSQLSAEAGPTPTTHSRRRRPDSEGRRSSLRSARKCQARTVGRRA